MQTPQSSHFTNEFFHCNYAAHCHVIPIFIAKRIQLKIYLRNRQNNSSNVHKANWMVTKISLSQRSRTLLLLLEFVHGSFIKHTVFLKKKLDKKQWCQVFSFFSSKKVKEIRCPGACTQTVHRNKKLLQLDSFWGLAFFLYKMPGLSSMKKLKKLPRIVQCIRKKHKTLHF